jgi:hypothetical protein
MIDPEIKVPFGFGALRPYEYPSFHRSASVYHLAHIFSFHQRLIFRRINAT